MTKEETYKYFDDHGISYEKIEHEAVWNMEDLQKVNLPHPEAMAKNLFVHDDKKQNYYLISVRGDKRVDLKEFRKEQGTRRLSFASEEEMMSILEVHPGAVTPLSLLNRSAKEVHWYLDKSFAEDIIGVHPNDNTATVILKTDDLIKAIKRCGIDCHILELPDD